MTRNLLLALTSVAVLASIWSSYAVCSEDLAVLDRAFSPVADEAMKDYERWNGKWYTVSQGESFLQHLRKINQLCHEGQSLAYQHWLLEGIFKSLVLGSVLIAASALSGYGRMPKQL